MVVPVRLPRSRGKHPQRALRRVVVVVVVDPPVFDHDPGLKQAVELLNSEAFVTKSAVERLDPGILPGLAWINEVAAGTVSGTSPPGRGRSVRARCPS